MRRASTTTSRRRGARPAAAALIAAALLLAGCSGDGDDGQEPAGDASSTEESTDQATPDASGAPSDPAQAAPPVELEGVEVAATVFDREITTEEVLELVEAQAGAQLAPLEGEELASARGQAIRGLLGREIQLEVVTRLASEEYGVDPSDADVDTALDEAIEGAGGEEAFEQFLATQGLDREQAREQVRNQVVVQQLRQVLAEEAGFDEESVREEFDARAAEGQFEVAEARHILVETEEEAEAALARVEDGEDFSVVAEDVSTDGSAANGGALGPAPRGSYVPPFEEAVWSEDTEIGEVVGPVETEFGFHLIIVDSREEQSFEDVEQQLTDELVGQAAGPTLNAAVEAAFADAEVSVDPAIGAWDPATGSVVAETPEG